MQSKDDDSLPESGRKSISATGSTLYTPCARRMLQDRVELRILIGDILREEADAVVFPADPDLRFRQESIERMFKIQMDHLFGLYKIYPERRVMKYDNLKLPNTSKVYFCAIPTWTGVHLV